MTMLQLQGFNPGLPGAGTAYGRASVAAERAEREICEFEIEELLRCVPQANDTGSVSLKDFLDAEANVLPGLTKLRLLQ